MRGRLRAGFIRRGATAWASILLTVLFVATPIYCWSAEWNRRRMRLCWNGKQRWRLNQSEDPLEEEEEEEGEEEEC